MTLLEMAARRFVFYGGRFALPLVLVLVACFMYSSAFGQTAIRRLTGTVTDHGHEPLKGAIVQLQDERTNSVTSYISEANGSFSFKRLNKDRDYRVWATYRGERSKSKELSHFHDGEFSAVDLAISFR